MSNYHNLNDLVISTDEGTMNLMNYNVTVADPRFNKAEAYFKNMDKSLVAKIHEHSHGFIFGCVAWLTSKNIIKALLKCKNV